MRPNPEQVYSDVGFEEAIERVGRALADRGWVASAVIDLERDWEIVSGPERINRITDGDEESGRFPYASIVASPARMVANDYGDVVIGIRDGRWAEERGLLLHEDFPLSIQRGLAGSAGSLISFEPSPRYTPLGSDAVQLCLASLNAGEAKSRALQRIWQNDLIAVNRNALSPGAHGPIAAIKALTEAVTQGQHLPLLSTDEFRPQFAAITGSLHPRAQCCIRTAEMLKPLMVNGLDASPVIVQYTKAVEIQVQDMLLRPLDQYWSSRTPPGALRGHGRLQRLYDYLFRGRRIELGTTAVAIKEALAPARDGEPVADSVRKILSRFPRPIWARSELPDEVLTLTSTARNPAAHTEIFSSADLPRVRSLVLGDARQAGLLEKLMAMP
jgi:hypothetical protein